MRPGRPIARRPSAAGPGSEAVTEVDAVVACPEAIGDLFSGAGTMQPGWFVSVDAEPSDPSIRYQVLVGTIVD